MSGTPPPAKEVASPTPKQVFEDPAAHWAFLTVKSDDGFEGQHFDRKEAGRAEADGTVHNTKLRNVREQINPSSMISPRPFFRLSSVPTNFGSTSRQCRLHAMAMVAALFRSMA